MTHFDVAISDGIAVVTFSRPPVNAIDSAAMVEMKTVFDSFADNRDVRVAIFKIGRAHV